MTYLPVVGLSLSFAGAVMISFSFGKNLEEAHQVTQKGRIVCLASFLHPRLFQLGMGLLSIGFLFQIVGEGWSLT